MNKEKRAWVKLFLVFLFLGFGIGCVSWTMFTMWAQSDNSVDAVSSFTTVYTAENVKTIPADCSVVRLNELKEFKRVLPEHDVLRIVDGLSKNKIGGIWYWGY